MDTATRLTLVALCAAAVALPSGPARADSGRAEEEPHHGMRRLLDALEMVDSPVYARNMLELKYEWTEKSAGASMTQLMFKPVMAWGERREFSLRIEAPVETYLPGAASGQTASSGFASLTTTLFFAFYQHAGLRQAVGLELQWNTASTPAVGAPWIIEPIYGIGYHFNEWLGLTLEVNWQKSFGNLGGYNPVNTVQFKPVVTVALPDWWFASVQDKVSWSLQDRNVGQLLKFTAGRFLTEKKSVVLAVEYETPLDPVAAQGEVMMVGAFLSYFYEW